MDRRTATRKGLFWTAIILGSLLVSSWVIVQWNLDPRVSELFYSPEYPDYPMRGWPMRVVQPWRLLYDYGTVPGAVFSVAALFAWFFCLVSDRYRRWHRYFLLVVLTAVIGGGLLVNAVFKPYWGRPRPGQTEQFGGIYSYRPVYSPGIPGKGESFPCGHCTMGFVFLTLFFFRKMSRNLALWGGFFGVVMGVLLSLTRIFQGAHYLSDTVWSLGIILLTAVSLYYFVLRIPVRQDTRPKKMGKAKKILLGAGILIAAACMVLLFLTRRPYYRSFQREFSLDGSTRTVVVALNVTPEQSRILAKDVDRVRIIIHSRGFGWTSAERTVTVTRRRDEDREILEFHIARNGYFSELYHQVEVWVPEGLKDGLKVEFATVPSAAAGGAGAP